MRVLTLAMFGAVAGGCTLLLQRDGCYVRSERSRRRRQSLYYDYEHRPLFISQVSESSDDTEVSGEIIDVEEFVEVTF